MAENDEGQERTEEATGRRREEAREKGQVARSHEVVSVSILVASLIYFYFGSTSLTRNIMQMMTDGFRNAARGDLNPDSIVNLGIDMFIKGFIIVIPLMLAVLIAGIMGNVIQVGFLFSTEALEPKLSKIDPIKGFQNKFSLRSLVELVKSLFKIIVTGAVAYYIVKAEIYNIITLMEQSVWATLIYFSKVCFKILLAT
ncbi:MAG TPA: EscU/YscU/HrcU family type III secretion system export apparatus switch protein, partial [Smithellaceae bacterium]|nr:EscU/YscU/HrcU family type III secretion system export apparatus switch protein [Smithellaceae bacterium]